jgi:hypothetical protein
MVSIARAFRQVHGLARQNPQEGAMAFTTQARRSLLFACRSTLHAGAHGQKRKRAIGFVLKTIGVASKVAFTAGSELAAPASHYPSIFLLAAMTGF